MAKSLKKQEVVEVKTDKEASTLNLKEVLNNIVGDYLSLEKMSQLPLTLNSLPENTETYLIKTNLNKYIDSTENGMILISQNQGDSLTLTLRNRDGEVLVDSSTKLKDAEKSVVLILKKATEILKDSTEKAFLKYKEVEVAKFNKKLSKRENKAYPNIEDFVHHSCDGVNNSLLKNIEFSPYHMEEYLKNTKGLPKEPNQEIRIGTAIHDYLLRPELAPELTAIYPDIDNRSDKGRVLNTLFELRNYGKNILEDSGLETVISCVNRLKEDELFTELLDCSAKELSAFYNKPVYDKNNKLLGEAYLKVRFDMICSKPSKKLLELLKPMYSNVDENTIIITDLKSIYDIGAIEISNHEIEQEIYNRKYHRQNALYEMVARKLLGKNVLFLFYFIEKPTLDVMPVVLNSAAIEVGAIENQILLEKYMNYINSDKKFKGRRKGITQVGLPQYSFSKVNLEIELRSGIQDMDFEPEKN